MVDPKSLGGKKSTAKAITLIRNSLSREKAFEALRLRYLQEKSRRSRKNNPPDFEMWLAGEVADLLRKLE